MKTKLFLKLGLGVSLFLATLVLSGGNRHVHAAELASTAKPTDSYNYVARSGDNLTFMVRRSVQLYAKAKQVKLSPATAIYCETNVVKKLGSYQIDVGQSVRIPFDTLQKYIGSGRKLSARRLLPWQAYVPNVSFDLGALNPVNLKKAQSVAGVKTSSASTNKSTQNQAGNKSSTPFSGIKWYGWVIFGAFAAATGYYFTRAKP